MYRFLLFAALSILAGCVTLDTGGTTSSEPPAATRSTGGGVSLSAFRSVQSRVEPIAEQICRNRTNGVNCDFRIVIDERRGLPPNAFQTLDKSGRPILGFTASLIADVRNTDEIAFIMGHEAAHHIAGHIPESQQRALEGAIVGTVLAGILGGDAATIETAGRVGGNVGARRFSKSFELEADSLGTIIAHRSGFNPVRGAQYFQRIPDPGNKFLGTHPPNSDRIEIVRRTAARL